MYTRHLGQVGCALHEINNISNAFNVLLKGYVEALVATSRKPHLQDANRASCNVRFCDTSNGISMIFMIYNEFVN